MFGLPSWLLIVPVLAALVFVHELGHYLAAKRFGIKVLEFGFGFPPRLWGIRRGETIYSINAIPLGGFVRMLGEEDPADPRSFARQAVWKRVVVLCAGSFMNFVTPLVIFTVVFMLPQQVPVGQVFVTGVAPGSPAQAAGVRAGDQIMAIDGERVRFHGDLIAEIEVKLGAETELTVKRGSIVSGLGMSPDSSVVETVTVVPRMNPPSLTVVETVTDAETEVSLREARRYNARLSLGDTMTQGAVGVMIGTSNLAVLNYALGTQEERDRRPIDDNYMRRYTNRNHTTLSEVLTGEKPGRENDAQTTVHHNFSAGIQFAAVGYLVYRYAKENGLGHELPLEWFQQDIRN